ncbi:hypothetical protein LJC10_03110 [Selenomonadales bacterium OttesenSCG-928-I06]|nr:hypothetical protein [Selenomonadales bacterium OttesenSCG-928-I06]
MNTKAEKFQSFLEETKIDCFTNEEIKDELNSVAFRSRIEVEGQHLPMIIIMDQSIYTMLRVQVSAKLVKDSNKNEILNYINDLNSKFKVFKYYVTEEGDLCLDSCILSTDDAFDGRMVQTVLDVVLKHLVEQYPILMRKIWAN